MGGQREALVTAAAAAAAAAPPPRPVPAGREACRAVAQALEARGVLLAGLWAMGTTKLYLKQAAQQRLEAEHDTLARRRHEHALRAALGARDLPALRAGLADALRLRMAGELVQQAQP